jgi:type II secretory pathway component GspD/PulD (secretin)
VGRTIFLRGPQATVTAALDIAKQLDVPPPPVTKTFVANYIKASQLVEAIKKLVPTGLDVIAGPGQETPSLSNIDPSGKTGQSSVSVTQDSSTGPASRTVILRGEQAAVAVALDIAKQLDIPRSQVSIGVTIHDISDAAVKDLGLTWNFTDLTLTETPAANGIGVGRVTRSPMTFDAAIKALETRDIAHLMASPNVSLLDGEKAFILIGDRINYPVLTGYTSTNSPIFSVNTERVGIYLQVAASISSDGYITLTLYPQVSSITGYLNVNGASYPQVSSREAQTTLRVKSGDAIVLGGLLQDQDILNVDKVPILSSIPFFGELFKHRTKTKNKSQVIITIRPLIVPQPPK